MAVKRNVTIRIIAALLMLTVLALAVVVWPVVRFLYRERTLAESVRRYCETTGVSMTPDEDIRQYVVKLAKHNRMEMSEGDVEIDYQDTPEAFGVPTRIGYTLSTAVDFHGLRVVPLVAQRFFAVKANVPAKSE
ncbi:hypothetical protein EBU99_03590 [bacterium]|nr:hypothetical protein [bacterium]